MGNSTRPAPHATPANHRTRLSFHPRGESSQATPTALLAQTSRTNNWIIFLLTKEVFRHEYAGRLSLPLVDDEAQLFPSPETRWRGDAAWYLVMGGMDAQDVELM
ncbi:hypothetical protein E2C01_026228 [Portunus trituberculatus]|uniref:Uncharacterized protein n=1 Tax=Portunus trituberculatus TaxID=210409 RepID=A0A5B7EK56_PORTR|nr:hypothetical protein [Portunus trituberculatus]